jgi:tetratricopeptide (TPR) repeat protein
MDPNFALVRENIAVSYLAKGLPNKAADEYIRALELYGESANEIANLRRAFELEGLRGLWHRRISTMEASWKGWHWDAFLIGWLYVRLSNTADALRWFEKAYQARSGSIIWLNIHPELEQLRSDPGFQSLLQRIGLP